MHATKTRQVTVRSGELSQINSGIQSVRLILLEKLFDLARPEYPVVDRCTIHTAVPCPSPDGLVAHNQRHVVDPVGEIAGDAVGLGGKLAVEVNPQGSGSVGDDDMDILLGVDGAEVDIGRRAVISGAWGADADVEVRAVLPEREIALVKALRDAEDSGRAALRGVARPAEELNTQFIGRFACVCDRASGVGKQDVTSGELRGSGDQAEISFGNADKSLSRVLGIDEPGGLSRCPSDQRLAAGGTGL